MAEPETMKRFAFACKLLTLSFLVIVVLALVSNLFFVRQLDFISFWIAAKLVATGHVAAAYAPEAHRAMQLSLGVTGTLLPFAYPPPFLLIVMPFAMMPYDVAAIFWVAITFALYLAAASKLAPPAPWHAAAFPPVLANAVMGQAGFLTGSIFITASQALSKRPLLGGALFGSLILKPQLAVLIPLAFIAARQWRAFWSAACSAIGLLLIGYLLFGSDAYAAFFKAMPSYSTMAFESPLGWRKMVSIYAGLRFLGASAPMAWAVHIIVALIAAAITFRIWSRAHDMQAKVAVLAAATALISPYLYLYDLLILALPFHWLASRGHGLWYLAILWGVLLLHLTQSWGFFASVNIGAVVAAALLLMMVRYLDAAPFSRARSA
jgi:hypothetical protein